MATDTWTSSSSGNWNVAADWSGGLPTSSSDVVIGSSSSNTTVISTTNVTINTIAINVGDALEVAGGTFTVVNASPSGNFGFIDVVTADFVIGNGTFNNSSTFQLDSTTPSESRLLIGGNVTFDGAGHINFTVSGTGDAGSNQITSQSGVATLTDVDNKIFGSGSIFDINFINQTTVETGVAGTLIIWGDAGGGSFNNQGLLQADEAGTLVLGNGADNANIANTGTIELNESGTGSETKMEIAGNVAINGGGGGQIVFSGPSSANNEIVSNGNPATLTLNGGELTGVGSIGDSNLTLNLESFLIEETKVQLVIAAASTTIDAGSKIEAAGGGEIFIQGPVTNSGILNVLTGGEIFLTSTVTDQGSGSIFIGPNGILSLVGNGIINGIVQFTGSGATLELSADHHISNSIQGTAGGDSFDLTYEPFQSGLQAVWQQGGVAGTLSLENNGAVLTTVSLQGQYTSAEFAVAEDANGNTLINDVSASPAVGLLSTLSEAQQTELIYIGYFNRSADPGGYSFWEGQDAAAQAGGQSASVALTNIANSFTPQPETIAIYPFLSNNNPNYGDPTIQAGLATFIGNVYENLFDRAADSGGVTYWTGQIESGAVGLGAAVLAIANGAQGSDATILQNKIAVALDFTSLTSLAANLPLNSVVAEAKIVLAGVDGVSLNDASVTAAEALIGPWIASQPTSLIGTAAHSAHLEIA